MLAGPATNARCAAIHIPETPVSAGSRRAKRDNVFDAPKISKTVLGLYDPVNDPLGTVAWRELLHASPAIKQAWVNHIFGWSDACKEAATDLRGRGRNCVIELALLDVREDTSGDTVQCAIDYEISVMRPRGKSFRVEESETMASFGQAAFLVGNVWRLADRVNDEIELREEAAAVSVSSNIA